MNNISKQSNSKDIIYLLLLIIIVFLLQSGAQEIKKWLIPEGNFLKLFIIVQLIISILLPVILYLKILGLPWKETLGFHRPPWKKTVIGLILGFLVIIVISIFLPIIITPTPELIQKSGSIASYGNFLQFLFALFTVMICASIVDELFFRGILLQGMLKKYGKIVAIVMTAILTALFHTWEPFKLVHAFLMGIIFASVVVWTNSVYTSIILHSLHNSLALIPQ